MPVASKPAVQPVAARCVRLLAKVADALNKMDVTTMFGRTRFSTDPKEHGLQIGHELVLAQWQKKGDKLVKEVIWPKAAKTADILY